VRLISVQLCDIVDEDRDIYLFFLLVGCLCQYFVSKNNISNVPRLKQCCYNPG
jgi:hypothetical protein